MAYTLSNKCTKNLCKRTVLLQLIIKNVVTCFILEHRVYIRRKRKRCQVQGASACFVAGNSLGDI